MATREGTSVTIVDNQRDGFEAGRTWGQRLLFNQNGEWASLRGQRLSDFQPEQTDKSTSPLTEAAGEQGLNMVLGIGVPLKQKQPMRSWLDQAGSNPTQDMQQIQQQIARVYKDADGQFRLNSL